MERSDRPVDEFIGSLDDDARPDIVVLDGLLSAVFADERRVLWEGKFWGGSDQTIIGYGDFRYESSSGKRVEWFKVGLARPKGGISVHVNAVEDGEYLVKRHAGELGKVKVGSASFSFKRIDSLDLQRFEAFIERARQLMD